MSKVIFKVHTENWGRGVNGKRSVRIEGCIEDERRVRGVQSLVGSRRNTRIWTNRTSYWVQTGITETEVFGSTFRNFQWKLLREECRCEFLSQKSKILRSGHPTETDRRREVGLEWLDQWPQRQTILYLKIWEREKRDDVCSLCLTHGKEEAQVRYGKRFGAHW